MTYFVYEMTEETVKLNNDYCLKCKNEMVYLYEEYYETSIYYCNECGRIYLEV